MPTSQQDQQTRENPALLDERIPGEPVRPEDASLRPEPDAPLSDRRRASDETAVHDPGSDANETVDGLNEQEEAVRQAAEEAPAPDAADKPDDATPVFDRGKEQTKL